VNTEEQILSISPDYQRDWPAYFRAVSEKPPRDTLVRALDHFESRGGSESGGGSALDLACGEGRDTRELLRRGWRVTAVDSHPLGLELLRSSIAFEQQDRLTTLCMRMEDLPRSPLASGRFDLVNASFALPFCHPDSFPAVWQTIVNLLAPGCAFAGQFFGDRDDWACIRPASHHSRAEVLTLLQSFSVLFLDEVEKAGEDAMGGCKHHHVFHILAQRLTDPLT
jgi:SAM-dependent methyltransferase